MTEQVRDHRADLASADYSYFPHVKTPENIAPSSTAFRRIASRKVTKRR
jgi:hypothetical protein